MDLNINNIDITKADLGIGRIYEPQTTFNLSQKEKDRISMEIEYLQVGEKMQFTIFDKDNGGSMDFRKLFRKKVKSISNLVINGKKVETSEEFLSYPAVDELDAIMMDVVLHIIKADSLNEDERKN